jgi:hypothetical protein
MLQTSLPDLPFTNYGNAELRPFGTHSAAKSDLCPRTDLKTLTHWTSFSKDIHQAITARAHLPSTPFTVKAWTTSSFVENEESLRAHAIFALHTPVREVLDMLGVKGRFAFPDSENAAIVGDPDFLWVTAPTQPHPKVIVRVPKSLTCVYLLINPLLVLG